jgi:phospholipid-binding lipoprotein MlaA
MEPPWRRRAVAACAVLVILAAALPVSAADESTRNESQPGLLNRLGTFAGRIYDTVDETAVAPASHVAKAVIRAPATQEGFSRIDDAMSSLVDTAGSMMGPIVEGATAIFTGPQVRQSFETVETIAQDFATALQRRVESFLPTAGDGQQAATVPESRARRPALPVAGTAGTFGPLDDSVRAAVEAEDPLEGFNRYMFELNDRLRLRLFHPVTDFYLQVTSPPVQAGVRHFFSNLREPVTVVSSLLQGRLGDAGTATARFGLNTTIGVAGIFDPAAAMGYPPLMRDLEETLCVYGLPSGPYLVLPIFGPGTIRDAAGRLATLVAYYEAMGAPIYVPYRITDIAVQSIDVQEKLTQLNSISIDPYVTQRVIYLTAHSLNCGRQGPVEREFFTK